MSDQNSPTYLAVAGFLKRWLLKVCLLLLEWRWSQGCMTPNSLNTTQKRKEKEGKRGEEKKRLLAGTHNFYIAYFKDSFWMTKNASLHTGSDALTEEHRCQKSK